MAENQPHPAGLRAPGVRDKMQRRCMWCPVIKLKEVMSEGGDNDVYGSATICYSKCSKWR